MAGDMAAQKLEPFVDWAICPHAPDQACACRKPKPKLILDFIRRDGLDPKQCWMLGDKDIDAACGINAGINGAVVREKANAGAHTYFATLADFVETLA